MADTTNQSEKAPRGADLLGLVQRNPKQTAYVLIGLGVLCALIPIWMGYKYKWEYLSVCLWGGALTLIGVCAGAALLLREEQKPFTLGDARMLLLGIGGLAGIATTLVGLSLALQWIGAFLTLAAGGAGAVVIRQVLVILLALIGGMALMFVSLLLGRTEVRTNPTLRRMLYGYNAVVGGVLLAAILVIVNVVIAARYPGSIDFTASHMYTLSDRSKNILRGLKEPVKIYVLVTRRFLFADDVKTLLTNCRDVNPKIQVEELSPDLDDRRVRELEKRFGIADRRDRRGLLIVYGDEPDVQHRFIQLTDMVSVDDNRFGRREERGEIRFKGEDALITALNFLTEGQKKPVIYFTQGQGELDLNNSDPSSRQPGAGVFKSRLEKRNFEVKPLQFDPADPKIPDDAALVVIARPRLPFSGPSIDALREYLSPKSATKEKGKLLALIGIEAIADTKGRETGLERLLEGFGVKLGNERLLSMEYGRDVVAVMNPQLVQADNKLAVAFEGRGIAFYQPRPVQSVTDGPPTGLITQSLMLAPVQFGVWAESNLTADVSQLRNALLKDRNLLTQKLSRQAPSVAAVVTESGPPDPKDPHAFMRQGGGPQIPRLAVFGDPTLAANENTTEGAGVTFELLASTIDWLRGREPSIGIPPRERAFFPLERQNVHLGRLLLLPALLMFVAIAALGTGVWVVRRK